MFNLIRKDFLVTFSNKFAFYLLLVMIPLFLFSIDGFDANTAFSYSILTFVFISTRTPFAYEVKGKPHLFIQSLPVTKLDIVVSKYLSIFIYFFIGTIFTLAYIFILSLLGFMDISKLLVETVIISLGINIGLLSLSLPAEFRFNPKISNVVNIIIYVVFLNFFIIGDGPLINFISLFSNYRIVITLILGLLYFLSMGISILIYKNRSFY